MNVIQIPNELQKHMSNLAHEVDLQEGLGSLMNAGSEVASSFSKLIANEGRIVVQKEAMLSFVNDLIGVDVRSYKASIDDFKRELLEIIRSIHVLVGLVHDNVETCRQRKHLYAIELLKKKDRLEYLNAKIEIAENSIKEYDTSADNYDRQANSLEESSNQSAAKSVAHAGLGISGGMLGWGIGAALAPFTGGASLVVGAAAAGASMCGNAVAVGFNIAEAIDLQNKAQNARQNASSARRERNRLVDERNSSSSEIKSLERKMDDIEVQTRNLKRFESFLYECVNSIQDFQMNSQAVETSITSALNQTQTLSIAQRANRRHSHAYEFGNKVLTDLKVRWRTLTECITDTYTAQRSVR